jgi:hypothetical protein
MKFTDEQIKRFWAKVDKKSENECWEWTAGRDSSGYGNFKLNGKTITASRLSWIIKNGPILNSCVVCHSCDNPPCINPGHLFLGTVLDNSIDMVKKNRHRWSGRTHCNYGHELTSDNVYVKEKRVINGIELGSRSCRKCANARSSEYDKNSRQKVNTRRREKNKKDKDNGIYDYEKEKIRRKKIYKNRQADEIKRLAYNEKMREYRKKRKSEGNPIKRNKSTNE